MAAFALLSLCLLLVISMYVHTLLCDAIFFAHAQVIQAALKNTLLLRHTWREVLHGRLNFGKVSFDRGAESTIAGYPNVLSQTCL